MFFCIIRKKQQNYEYLFSQRHLIFGAIIIAVDIVVLRKHYTQCSRGTGEAIYRIHHPSIQTSYQAKHIHTIRKVTDSATFGW